MARDFDGTADYMHEAIDLSSYSDKMSISFWINADTWAGNQMMFETTVDGFSNIGGVSGYKHSGIADNFQIGFNDGANHTGNFAIPGIEAAPGVWEHFLVVYDMTLAAEADETKFYYNGVSQTRLPAGGGASSGVTWANDSLYLGARTGAVLPTNGKMAEVGLWPGVALTQADATMLAKRFSPEFVYPQGLLRHYKLMGRVSPEPSTRGGAMTLVSAPPHFEHPPIINPTAQILQFPPVAAAGGFQAAWARRQSQIIGAGVR